MKMLGNFGAKRNLYFIFSALSNQLTEKILLGDTTTFRAFPAPSALIACDRNFIVFF